MSAFDAIEAAHAACTPKVCDIWVVPAYGEPVPCDTAIVIARLREVEAERDAWRTSWENDVDTVARRCDEWKHELSNLALDRERERDAAEADAKALALELQDAIYAVHQTGSLRDHADPTVNTGWVLAPLDRCEDVQCVDGLAALAAHRERVKEGP